MKKFITYLKSLFFIILALFFAIVGLSLMFPIPLDTFWGNFFFCYIFIVISILFLNLAWKNYSSVKYYNSNFFKYLKERRDLKNRINLLYDEKTQNQMKYYRDNYESLSKREAKKYTANIEILLNIAKEKEKKLHNTKTLVSFLVNREKMFDALNNIVIHEKNFSFINKLPSEDITLLNQNMHNIEIEFLKRTYIRNDNGMLIINSNDLPKILQNFTDEAIQFISKDNYGIDSTQIESFDNMDGHDFEHFCAKTLMKNGFYDVNVTQGSGDQGIDVIAFKDGIKYGIQCKCYSGNVGNHAVQEAYSGCKFYDCHVPVVLTNAFFTESAKELAQKNNVLLWDRNKLLELINN